MAKQVLQEQRSVPDLLVEAGCVPCIRDEAPLFQHAKGDAILFNKFFLRRWL